jgi:hypothetical protein
MLNNSIAAKKKLMADAATRMAMLKEQREQLDRDILREESAIQRAEAEIVQLETLAKNPGMQAMTALTELMTQNPFMPKSDALPLAFIRFPFGGKK